MGRGLILDHQVKWQMYSNETLPLPLPLTLDARCGYSLKEAEYTKTFTCIWEKIALCQSVGREQRDSSAEIRQIEGIDAI